MLRNRTFFWARGIVDTFFKNEIYIIYRSNLSGNIVIYICSF